MWTQVATLKFSLGSKYENIVIRDVQLWQDVESFESPVRQLMGSFVQYVDLDKLPVWVVGSGSVSSCLTSSATALAYFTSKLRRDRRGIVVKTGDDFMILHRDDDKVRCLTVDLTAKATIDSQIDALEVTKGIAAPPAKHDNIDVILRQSQQRKTVSDKKVLKSLHVSEKRLQFNETLSKLILGGLRLRGIPNSQFGFQKLFKMTFNAAEFSHRKQLQALTCNMGSEVPFEELQATVETLLELFTRS